MVYVDEVMLIYAFRYALGRQSHAVSDVANELIAHGHKLEPEWRTLIVRDIEAYKIEHLEEPTDTWDEVVAAFEVMNT